MLLGAGVIAGTANLVNLLDLRPGPGAQGRRCCSARRWPAARAAGIAAGPAGAAAGAAAATTSTSEIMLGDAAPTRSARCSASALAARTGPPAGPALLAVLAALTAASEKVSFTQVIQRTPGLRELDALGRRTD